MDNIDKKNWMLSKNRATSFHHYTKIQNKIVISDTLVKKRF